MFLFIFNICLPNNLKLNLWFASVAYTKYPLSELSLTKTEKW